MNSSRNDRKVLVVTGASSGIGEAVVRYAASQGHHVVLGARRIEKLKQLADELNSRGAGKALAIPLDVTEAKSVASFFNATIEAFGKIDLCLVNAGIDGQTHKSFFKDQNPMSEIRAIMEINLFGSYLTIWHAMPYLRKNPGSALVQVSSITSALPGTCTSAFGDVSTSFAGYAVSKSAVDSLVRLIYGSELGKSPKNRVRVYSINPAFFASELVDRVSNETGVTMETMAASFNPVRGTIGDPSHIGELVVSILEDKCGYPSGGQIVIDNDATFSLQELYKDVVDGHSIRGQSCNITRDSVRDVTGNHPYRFDEKDKTKKYKLKSKSKL